MDFQGIIGFIRNFFKPTLIQEKNRKRRALDPIDSIMSPKLRRLQPSLSRDVYDFDRENYFISPKSFRRTSIYKTPSRNLETIVLDEEDDGVIEIKKTNGSTPLNNMKEFKFTSTPHSIKRSSFNGTEEDIAFVKEIKSAANKKSEASKRGLNYIKPFSGSIFRRKTFQTDRELRERSNLIPAGLNGNTKFNESIRLDDKMHYKKLLEMSNDSSIYFTPKGELYKSYDGPNRINRIMTAALKSPGGSSKSRMSTKETIKKILDNFESDPVIIKDSDSDSDVVLVSPPSPKPDIKVDPINTFKTVVDTSEQTKPEWLERLVTRHKKLNAERQKEIDYLKDCSEKHGQINKDMRMEVLTNNVQKSLQIKDIVLPVDEKKDTELPALTNAQLKMVSRAFKGDPNEVLNRKFNLSVTRRDLLTLAGLNWLNDEVINFYMNMIIERGKDANWPKAYGFNTFFYPKLAKDGHSSLRRWTKKVDIFQYDIICVPIHLGMHWCMAIIDLRNKSIRYFDSMGSSNNRCLDALRRYLQAEHLDKKGTEFDISEFELENVKDVPQQMNGSDCGMFSCTFAEFITRDAEITFTQEEMPYLRKKMVVEILTGELLIK